MLGRENKIAIVTGASSGIWRETVLELLKAGYEVHAGARRLEAMSELKNAGVSVYQLDLTRPGSIEAFAVAILRLDARLDVLVNNAGYGAYGAIEDIPMTAAREQMEVNLFGLVQLVKAVFDHQPRLVKATSTASETLPQNAVKNTFLPFHPGAVRYYREVGIRIPAELVPTN